MIRWPPPRFSCSLGLVVLGGSAAGSVSRLRLREGPRDQMSLGAFRVGGQDDLVTALGMALQVEIPVSRPRHSTGSISDLKTSLGAEMRHIFRPLTHTPSGW